MAGTRYYQIFAGEKNPEPLDNGAFTRLRDAKRAVRQLAKMGDGWHALFIIRMPAQLGNNGKYYYERVWPV